MRIYHNHDQVSQYIRSLTDAQAHMYLCHGGVRHPTTRCEDGCQVQANPVKLAAYNKAYEESGDER